MKKEKKFSENNNRWQAVIHRDTAAEGAFVYGVSTTGIYCRPVCPSRLPLRENVRFFDTWQQAEEAGFRPCKRCTPREAAAPDPAVEAVSKACRLIEKSPQELSLSQLAAAVGLSPYHFQRQFKKVTGISPKKYSKQKRLHKVRSYLQKEGSITEAIYAAGYQSGSRFYENAQTSLGMKPAEFQNGGAGIRIRYGIFQSDLGWILVALSDKGVCRIDIDENPQNLQARLSANFPQASLLQDDPDLAALIREILSYLQTPRQGLSLPLDIQGTAFQKRVWDALQHIQPGSRMSYTEIAKKIGSPKAARAVARACAANKLALAIPCHRVVRSDGQLGGYRWGLERKKALLEKESANTEQS